MSAPAATSKALPTEVDVAVIGLGPGGEAAAGRLANEGLSVLAIDRHLVGGECPYYGCVPSKMMIRAANALAEARRVDQLAGRAIVEPDYAPVARRIRQEATSDWDDSIAVERLESAGAKVVHGAGALQGTGQITVNDQPVRVSRAVILNPGTSPTIPPIPGLADTPFWTNRDLVEVTELPASLIIIGGGAIGLEFGQAWARFGVTVTIVESGERILASEEPTASEQLEQILAEEGVTIQHGTASSVAESGGEFRLAIEGGPELRGEALLVATGRRANLAGLGLGAVGIADDGPFIPVDHAMRAAPGVWAIGDAVGQGAFTHVSMHQSRLATDDILGRPVRAGSALLTSVVFTDPEVARTGKTAAEAEQAGYRIRVGDADLASSARGFIHGAGGAGLVRLVVDTDTGLLLGATVAGPAAGEVIGLLAVAIHAGVPVTTLAQMAFAYPTFHRGIADALEHVL